MTTRVKSLMLPVVAAITAFVAVAPAMAASFLPTYTINSVFNIGPYLLFTREAPEGSNIGAGLTRGNGNGGFFTSRGTSTIVSNPTESSADFRSIFMAVSDLQAAGGGEPSNHLILGVTNNYSGSLIGQEFGDIFSEFDEAALINAVLTVSDFNLGNAEKFKDNEPEFRDAFAELYRFESALTDHSTFSPYFRVNEGFSMVGFSQGQFVGDGVLSATPVSAVPEPATWVMMIGGFGLVGGAMRRRRKLPVTEYAA